MPDLKQIIDLLNSPHALSAVLFLLCLAFGFAAFKFWQAYDKLSKSNNATIADLTKQLSEVNKDFADANKDNSDGTVKITEALNRVIDGLTALMK